MNIFLDDIRNPADVTWVTLPKLPSNESWTVVRNYNQFCDVVKHCMLDDIPVERVCFDHDLADAHYGGDYSNELTGNDCAKVLVDACLACDWEVPEFVVHSMNPVARDKIELTMGDIEKARREIHDWATMPHPWKTT